MVSISNSLKTGRSYLKLTYRPDGSFAIGASVPPRKDSQPSATEISTDTWWNGYKDVSVHHVQTNHAAIERQLASSHPGTLTDDQRARLFDAYESAGQYEPAIALAEFAGREPGQPMGLSVATNSHKSRPRKKRGTSGITSRGKWMTRSAGAILERDAGKECLSLVTCTLPIVTEAENRSICESWSDLVRKFFQEVGRLLTRKGLSTNYVYVTEIQERRFERYGQVAPHLHALFQGRLSKRCQWAISKAEIRALWERILSNHLNRPVDGGAATRIESPRKSMVKELGKYLSKGCKIVDAITEAGKADLLPSSWWGASKELKAKVNAEIVVYKGDVVNFILKNIDRYKMQGLLAYRHIYTEFVDHQTGIRREIRVGTVGFFRNNSAMSEILKEFENKQVLQLVA